MIHSLAVTDFGGYSEAKFTEDLLGFNDGRPLSPEQSLLIGNSLETMQWLGGHGVQFEPIYSRQSFEKDGRHVFWGGLTLAAQNEGVGLFDMELAAFERLGGRIRYNSAVTGLMTDGDLDLPAGDRKNYRKICYFLGVMLNADGVRFVDEGINFRNYTYAQFGRAVLEQPGHFAWQVFDSKVTDLLYEEYRFHDAHFVEADTLEALATKMEGVDSTAALATSQDYNTAVDQGVPFDPTSLDGKGTRGLQLAKSNWAQTIDTPPFRAFPVTGGITFTYGGLKVSDQGAVMHANGTQIDGLFACGELVGGVFFNGYPGGSGLTSGAVFGRRAGAGACRT